MANINGTNNSDTLFGTNDADTINGLGGNDALFGFGGDDRLLGGAGADGLGGGQGNDTLNGGGGADILGGGVGADRLIGGTGIDTASYAGSGGGVNINLATGVAFGGEAEGDTLSGIENVIGTGFDDFMVGDDGANVLTGLNGNDLLFGQGGDDVINGGEGQDSIDGGAGIDAVTYIDSTEGIGVNLIFNSGGFGDTLTNVENVDGSNFRDFLFGDNRDNRLQGFDGQDRLFGMIGNDVLFGGNDNDVILGGFSNDTIDGGSGGDYLNGEQGIDAVSYATSTAAVDASLASGDAFVGADNDAIVEFENLIGSAFNDRLSGDGGANVLSGLDGRDEIFAGDGADVVVGGIGADLLAGEGGNDHFNYTALGQGIDNIADFSNIAGNDDTLGFKSDAFGNLPLGALSPNRFVANTSGVATSLDQRFVYETDTGFLRFDANGSAAGGVAVIAAISGAPILTAADFVII